MGDLQKKVNDAVAPIAKVYTDDVEEELVSIMIDTVRTDPKNRVKAFEALQRAKHGSGQARQPVGGFLFVVQQYGNKTHLPIEQMPPQLGEFNEA